MQTILGLCSDTLRYAVHKQFHLVCIIVIAPKIHFLTRIPVPMREKMQNRLISPLRLVEIVHILREASQIHDSEIRTSGRPAVWSRLSNVVEARPYILSADEIIVTYQFQSLFVSISPRSMAIVI
jgi:hypothetical protein